MKRRLLPLTVLLMILGVSGGCTSDRSDENPNTLNLVAIAKIKGFDPALASDLYSGREVAQVFEGLYEYHWLKRPYELIPAIAADLPKFSKDRKTLTIEIKKGIVFQDDPAFKETGGKGREVTAADFVYSFKRLADPKIVSDGWWIFNDRVVGLNQWREAAVKAGEPDYAQEVEGLKALDRYTLQIKLIKPSAQFLYYLAMPYAFVVPREAVELYGKDFLRNPVGTGPFRLVREESNLNSRLVYERNPTFRKQLYPSDGATEEDKKRGLLQDAGKQIPFADRVVTTVIVESQPRWLNFMSGKLDMVEIPKDNFDQAVSTSQNLTPEMKKKGIVLLTQTDLDVTHITFNMDDPLLGKNKYLRQAMSTAFDVKPYIHTFFNGRAVPALGPIPPGLKGYDPDLKNPYRTTDIEKAKELLKKAGYPDGEGLPVLDYATLSNSTNRQMAEYFIKEMKRIGVRLKISAYTWPEFLNAVKNRKGQLFAFAWKADYPDAENFLQLFYSDNVSPGPNDANYSNPEFDRLYKKALTLQDTPARTALYKKMAAILVEDTPWLWLVHRKEYITAQPWLRNLKLHVFDHSRSKYLRVDVKEKSKRMK